MPFIEQTRREIIDSLGLDALKEIAVGDRCYVYYKGMVDQWKAMPRWRTAHAIYINLYRDTEDADNLVAEQLAWQVFFQLYVIPYELRMREKNGDI